MYRSLIVLLTVVGAMGCKTTGSYVNEPKPQSDWEKRLDSCKEQTVAVGIGILDVWAQLGGAFESGCGHE